jgi:flagellar basal-body rod protein FlgB
LLTITTMSIGIEQLFNYPTTVSLKLSLQAAALTHTAIASNIANVNTPGYQRVDVSNSFKSNLDSALHEIDKGQFLGQPAPTLPTGEITKASLQNPARYDGNTVNMDQEMTQLIKNDTDFDFSARLLAMKYSAIKAAITGKTGS